MKASHQHHHIDYIEFGAVDLQAAKEFYAASFDWTFADYGPEYVGIRIGDREFGGFRREENIAPGGPLVILYSESLEDSLRRVRSAGGRITREIFEFPGGRRFQFCDPSGNELAVWSES